MDSATVVILGTTGHGKSLLGNRLLRLNPNDNSTFHFKTANTHEAETMESETYSAVIRNYNLTVIDTPGLFDIEKDVMKRWVDILKAVLLAENGIDAILFVANSRELHSAACCFNRIKECFEGLNMTRVIIVFTYVNNTSPGNLEGILTDFNNELKCGAVGVRYIFSDQHTIEDVVDKKMSDIIKHVKDIKKKSFSPIDRAVFVKYTEKYLRQVLQTLPQKNVSLEDLRNSPSTDMVVIEEFINREDINKMIDERNESREGCIVS